MFSESSFSASPYSAAGESVITLDSWKVINSYEAADWGVIDSTQNSAWSNINASGSGSWNIVKIQKG